jgi:hypothetical protein
MTKEEFLDEIGRNLSAYLKICIICEKTYKDTLDKELLCKECAREQKINQILV